MNELQQLTQQIQIILSVHCFPRRNIWRFCQKSYNIKQILNIVLKKGFLKVPTNIAFKYQILFYSIQIYKLFISG